MPWYTHLIAIVVAHSFAWMEMRAPLFAFLYFEQIEMKLVCCESFHVCVINVAVCGNKTIKWYFAAKHPNCTHSSS